MCTQALTRNAVPLVSVSHFKIMAWLYRGGKNPISRTETAESGLWVFMAAFELLNKVASPSNVTFQRLTYCS